VYLLAIILLLPLTAEESNNAYSIGGIPFPQLS